MAGEHVLIVDDEEPIVELLTDILTAEGYRVDSASTAEQALSRIRENIYDLALLDFNLPDMDGVMLHHQIRRIDEDLARRCIFMSGLVQSDSNLSYYMAQSRGFLAKPFDIAEVLSALREILREEA